MKITTGRLAALAGIVLVAAYCAWPLWSGLRLKNAIISGDTAALEMNVDWPSVRASLKQSLPPYLSRQGMIARALTAAFGAFVVDKAVETFVTAEGLVKLMESPEQRANLDPRNIRWAMFAGLTRFELTVKPPKYPDTRMISTFELRKWRWKLMAVRVVTAGS